ncbi:translocation/assembly module TamB domain-containing protein [Spirulina major CS-329]|uniref:translocation/assembly module TamB domain-containing protein n=1 Tax=Spirulina TaxID=1154 RepID=UPI00232CDBC2|nr:MULTISPECIES: translocation/assembly module TamB [Spirulina]MDB9493444.1 translocation/assembly module TamB domain-containing protein [Spirulina subsalsa CS-330]MDB9505193.1 translocation/assembly module TamB domain-containing protein [Spirulina major CS-329]
MTDQTPETQPNPPKPRRRRWIWWLIFGVAGSGSAWIVLWVLVQQLLQPLIAKQLTNTLERPVELGAVTRLSPTAIHFNKTRLPTTADDADYATTEAVAVRFNPLKVIFERRLELDITFADATVYVEQDRDGQWINLPTIEEGNLPIKIRVVAVRVDEAIASVVRRNPDQSQRSPLVAQVSSGNLFINGGLDDLQVTQLQGTLAEGGRFRVQGKLGLTSGSLDTLTGTLAANLQGVEIPQVMRLIPPLPLDTTIPTGTVGANVTLTLQGNPFTLETLPTLTGVGRVQGVTVQVEGVKSAARLANAKLRFRGDQVLIDGATARLGTVPVELDGAVSLSGQNDLQVRLEPVAVTRLLAAVVEKLELPIALQGAIAMTAQVLGPLEDLGIGGQVRAACLTASPCLPLRVDRVGVRSLNADFIASVAQQTLSVESWTLIPEFGGRLTGKAIATRKDPKNPIALLETQWNQIPINRALQTFQVATPVALGTTSGNATVSLPLNNWQAAQVLLSTDLLGGRVQVGNVGLTENTWQATVFAQQLRLPLDLPLGATDARLRVAGRWEALNLDAIAITGQTQTRIGAGRLVIPQLQLAGGQFVAQLQAQNIAVQPFAAQLPAQLQTLPLGNLNGQLTVAGALAGFRPTRLVSRGAMGVGIAGGTAQLLGLRLQGDRLTASLDAQNLNMAQLAQLFGQLPINRAALGRLGATVQVATPFNALLRGGFLGIWDGLQVNGMAIASGLGGGTGNVAFTLSDRNWTAQVQGEGINSRQLLPQLPAAFGQSLQSRVTMAGVIPRRFTVETLQLQGQGTAQMGRDRLAIPQFSLRDRTLTARLLPDNIALAPYSNLLRGQLTGQLDVRFPLFDLAQFQAQGAVRFSEGLIAVRDPIDAEFGWRDGRLTLNRLQGGEQLTAQGYLQFDLPRLLRGQLDAAVVQRVDLGVIAQNLDLAALPEVAAQFVTLPTAAAWADLRGLTSFEGRIAGTLTAPQIEGDLSLVNVAVNQFQLDPILTGPVSLQPGGSEIALRSEQAEGDRILVTLNANYLPTTFDLRLDQLIATGRTENNILTASLTQFPLAQAKPFLPNGLLPPLIAAQPLAGDLTGQFTVDWRNWGVAGSVTIEKPVVGQLRGDRFTGDLQYVGNAIALREARLQTGSTLYEINGSLIPTGPEPRVDGTVAIENGRVEDIFAALDLVKFSDLLRISNTFGQPAPGQAADLNTLGVGRPDDSLGDRLSRLSEIRALNELRRQDSIDALPFPGLDAIAGSFSGAVTLSGALSEGIGGLNAQVELNGSDWQWGAYQADTVTLIGSLAEGIVTIRPLELQTAEGVLALAGVFGNDEITGQLQINDFPIITLQDLLPLPPAIGFGGTINLTATLGGDRANPRLLGRVNILGASVNETPIDTATANFSYNNAKLRFSATSTLMADGTPLTAAGQFPYQLPIPGTLPPSDNQATLTARVQDDGLAILNIISRQNLIWQGGSGDVNVDIRGQVNPDRFALESLVADGSITITDGVLGSKLLPETITDLDGVISLNFDQIDIESITGDFGGGSLTVAGSLPTFQRQALENPLTVTLDQLAIALQGVFSGIVGGSVQILGTALAPEITGNVNVTNGNVQLLGAASLSGAADDSPTAEPSNGFFEFRDLRLILADDFRIRLYPILDLVAQGDLVLNGSFSDLQPDGVIDLNSGYVNLFTTTFRLDNNYNNVAVLNPLNGLDPFLDLRLVGSVIETSRRTFAVESLSAEVSDSPVGVGGIQNLTVRADINATAFELAETLRATAQSGTRPRQQLIDLSSSPARSDTEILALLGGSFINSVAGGDNTALVGGLANIAGTTLFGDLQQTISNALSLSEFRVFPAQVLNEDSTTGTLGIAVEVGKTIANDFSLSVLQFITPPGQDTRYNIRYRINDNLTIRGSTDFQGDSRGSIEFETRF